MRIAVGGEALVAARCQQPLEGCGVVGHQPPRFVEAEVSLVERHTLPAGEGRAVAVAAGLRRPGIALAERRHADDAGDRTARLQHCHQHAERSEEHTYELQSLMRSSYAVFFLKKQT